MSYIEKEKLIKADIASIENRVRHAFNQGYDLGYKEGKERAKPQEQEPTTRNCFGCQYSKDNHNAGTEKCHLCMWENQYTPITKNDLGVDCISRKSIKQKLQEHHDFFVNAYGGFSNLPQNDKSRVDEITNCIAMVVNEPPVIPQEPMAEIDLYSVIKQKYIEREVLDKIRAEIAEYGSIWVGYAITKDTKTDKGIEKLVSGVLKQAKEQVLDIIDKYRAESEG